ncbi:hypothetical protein HK102_007439 [Quaeritorhiza haematococci]|nr:hypothetical protein HK102_007439 [Quaeritorhiza haematococci]
MNGSTCWSWNDTLPYDVAADGITLLADIRNGLATCAAAGDFAPGCVFWVRQLKRYLELKYTLSAQDRASFARLLFDIVCTPNLHTQIVDIHADVLVKLLKKEELLPDHLLVLPWRPLYDVLRKTYFPKQRDRVLPGTGKHLMNVVRAISRCRRYFSAEATAEILEEFLPAINVHKFSHTQIVVAFMCQLLPTVRPPPLLPELQQQVHQQQSSSSASPVPTIPRFYWVSTLFSLWSLIAHSPGYDESFLDVFSRLAERHVGEPHLVGWTEEHIARVFTCGLRNLEIPVGSGSSAGAASGGLSFGGRGLVGRILAGMSAASGGDGGGSKVAGSVSGMRFESSADGSYIFELGRRPKLDSFATFIAYTVYPSSNSSTSSTTYQPPVTSLSLLTDMIRALESYFHPSNIGRWTYPLTRFLALLSAEFLRRIKEEQDPHCTTPRHLRLTPTTISQFASVLRPVTFLAMFGKDAFSVSSAHAALRSLAYISPTTILPSLLERCYPALETLTQTHRTLSCIGALGQVAPALVNRKVFKRGARHIVPLLTMVLPGIDVNDASKTYSTLMFVTNVMMWVPVVDMTREAVGKSGGVEMRGLVVTVGGGDRARASGQGDLGTPTKKRIITESGVPERPPKAPRTEEAATSAATSAAIDNVEEEVNKVGGMLMQVDLADNDDGGQNDEDDEEEELAVRNSTAGFEEFVVGFLDRIFMMFENLPQEHGLQTNKNMESGLLTMCLQTCNAVFTQLSPDLHALALRKVVSFATGNVIPSATKAFGFLCGSTMTSPSATRRTLSALLPLCSRHILSELEHGAGSEAVGPTGASARRNPFGFAVMGDCALHWWQSILYRILTQTGSLILEHSSLLLNVLNAQITSCKSWRAYKWTAKSVRNLLWGLVGIYPLQSKLTNGAVVGDEEEWESKKRESHRYWGASKTAPGATDLFDDADSALHIRWHVPSKEEVAFAVEVVRMVVPKALERLTELADLARANSNGAGGVNQKKELSGEFCRWLTLLRHCMSALATLAVMGGDVCTNGSVVDGSESDLRMSDDDSVDPEGSDRDADTDIAPQSQKRYISTGLRASVSTDTAAKEQLLLEAETAAELRGYQSEIGRILNDLAHLFGCESSRKVNGIDGTGGAGSWEDDIDAITGLLKSIKTFLCNRSIGAGGVMDQTKQDVRAKGIKFAKSFWRPYNIRRPRVFPTVAAEGEDGATKHSGQKTRTRKNELPPYLARKRAYFHHTTRMYVNSLQQRRPPTTAGATVSGLQHMNAILDAVVEMCLGRYSAVRRAAQGVLLKVTRCWPFVKYRYFKVFMDAVKEPRAQGETAKDSGPRKTSGTDVMVVDDVADSALRGPGKSKNGEEGAEGVDPADRMKGALFVLMTHKFMSLALNNWSDAALFLETLCRAQWQDKPSVQACVRKVYREYLLRYCDLTIEVSVPASVQAAAEGLAAVAGGPDASLNPQEVSRLRQKVESKAHKNRKTYRELVETLTTLLDNPSLHWYFSSITVNSLELILRDDEPIPVTVVRRIVEGVNSEHPALRKICLVILSRVLLFLKKRSGGDAGESKGERQRKLRSKTPSEVNKFELLFPKEKAEAKAFADSLLGYEWRDISNEEWDKTTFIDENPIGWYCSPTKCTAYRGSPQDREGDEESLPYEDPSSTETMSFLLETFTSEKFWKQFLTYQSQEQQGVGRGGMGDRDGADGADMPEMFTIGVVRFYKAVFGMFGDRPLHVIRPLLVDLCKDAIGADGESSLSAAGAQAGSSTDAQAASVAVNTNNDPRAALAAMLAQGGSPASVAAAMLNMNGGNGVALMAGAARNAVTSASSEKSRQRAAAELLTGLIRGTKHWSWKRQRSMWDGWLGGLVEDVLSACTPQGLLYWDQFLRYTCSNRDPRRLYPLLKIIFEAKLDPSSQSFFSEAKKVHFVYAIFSIFSWRLLSPTTLSSASSPKSIIDDVLLPMYLSNLQHPYQQVRSVLASTLNEIAQIQWHPSASSYVEILAWNLQNHGGGMQLLAPALSSGQRGQTNVVDYPGDGPTKPTANMQAFMEQVVSRIAGWREQMKTGDEEMKTGAAADFKNASKTVLGWMQDSLQSYRVAGVYPYLSYFIAQLFGPQDDYSDDTDLQHAVATVARLYPVLPHPSRLVAPAVVMMTKILEGMDINTVMTISGLGQRQQSSPDGQSSSAMLTTETPPSSTATSWHVKVQILPVLQVFFFRHLFLLKNEVVLEVMNSVSDMLEDPQIEVRQLASVTLSGLIRCSQRGAITQLEQRFESMLAEKLPKRRRAGPSSSPSKQSPEEKEKYATALVKRHAGVLGLASLVQAFPYEVPKWMPNVLVKLAAAISDPSPIGPTIQKTFTEFRRTHQDTWHEDMTVFTEDQLYLLSDLLISPSYYA